MTKSSLMVAGVLGVALGAASAGAGNLNPPGGPVLPTMKDLDTVEPRIPLSLASAPGDAMATHVISQSGSYYLTANLIGVVGKDGIKIDAPNVTLDLSGFAVIGAPGATITSGIRATLLAESVKIHSGSVRGWGGAGICAERPGILTDLILFNNTLSGLVAAQGSIVERVHAENNGDIGVFFNGGGTIRDSVAVNNGSIGIGAGGLGLVATNCFALGNGFRGFQALDASVLTNCSASFNTPDGILLGDGATAIGCSASSNTTAGFIGFGSATLIGCTADQNATSGFDLAVPGSTLSGCTANDNVEFGFFTVPFTPTDGGGSLTGCTARNNGIDGFCVGPGSTVESCTSNDNTADGFFAREGSTIRNCTAIGNGDDGISVGASCAVIGNTLHANNFGIFTTGNGCRIDSNTVENSVFTGFLLQLSDHLVVRNLARLNNPDYIFFAGTNQAGPIITTFGTITSENPWANFGGTSVAAASAISADGAALKLMQIEPDRSPRERPEIIEIVEIGSPTPSHAPNE